MRWASKRVATLLFALALTYPGRGLAADRGTIEGIVTDPFGAVVQGALITASNTLTAASFSVTTDDHGLFRFAELPLGIYEVTVERSGFARLIQKNVVVNVGGRTNLPLALSAASVVQSVVVNASDVIVETTRSQQSTTIDHRFIDGLPVNGRNASDFVLLTPGVTRDARTGQASFAGQRTMNSLLVDGLDTNQTFWGLMMGAGGAAAPYQFSLATVEEFQVNSNAYSAELGRAGAGVINLVTKSGTNEPHGTGFWFYRDKALNANDAVNRLTGRAKSPYHFNQFGGEVGGPVVRDKLFFLFAEDSQRSTIENVVSLNLPTTFAFSADPVVAGFQRSAVSYLSARSASWNRTYDQDVTFAKIDWQIGGSHHVTGRWNRQRFTGEGLENGGSQNALEHSGTSSTNTDSIGFVLTSVLSPSHVNVMRFGFVRSDEPGSAYSPNSEASVFQDGQLVLTVGRNPISPRENRIRRLEWSDSSSLVRGSHSLKAGGSVLWDRIDFFTASQFSGTYRFASLESFGRSLSGAPIPLAGEFYTQAFSGSNESGITTSPNSAALAFFLQDEWRLHRQVTLNAGMRYDLQLIAKPLVKNPSAALVAASLDTSFVPRDDNNLAPRAGIAWKPFTDSERVVIRGGYGVYFATVPSIVSARAFFQNGVSIATRTFRAGTSDASSIPRYPDTLCGPPDPSGVPPSCAAPIGGAGKPNLAFFSPDFVQPYTQQGSAGIEIEPWRRGSMSASYLWVRGSHLQRTRDVNLATPTARVNIGVAGTNAVLSYQNFSSPRPLSEFDRIWNFDSSATSTYHGLAVQMSQRLGLTSRLLASYTLSRVIDDAPFHFAVNPGVDDFEQVSDSSNPQADRGPGATDQRHLLVVSGIWRLDVGRRLPRVARAILGAWDFSWIFTVQSGRPYSGLVSFDLNGDGNTSTDRPPGQGRNTFNLPATISLDPRLTRQLPLTKRLNLQLIVEAFNVFNRTNVSGVRTTQFSRSTSPDVCGVAGTPCLVPQNSGPSAFGTPTMTSGPRIVQVSTKLGF